MSEVLNHGNQAIGIFNRAALPGMMGVGEIEYRSGRFFNFRVLVELGSIIRGDRLELSRLSQL